VKIAYLPLSPTLASVRLRAVIPARYLSEHGFEVVREGADWVVLSKHGWSDEVARGHKRVLFDVCDDHFSSDKRDHYLKWCRIADRVTCNSEAMAEVIKDQTGRDAVVIPDPYESDERPPKCGMPALWFGHKSNLKDLLPYTDRLPLVIVSNPEVPGVIPWSRENLLQAFEMTGITVIPTGKSKCKSANRAIEAIRNGHFPVCGHLPAYADLGLGCDDIATEAHRAVERRAETLERIDELQHRVRYEFSPQRIGELWSDCFST